MSRFLLPQLAPSLESKVWRIDSRWGRSVALTTVVSLVMATIPGFALAAEKPVRELSTKVGAYLDGKSEPLPPSRILTANGMKQIQGRDGENPYLAGQDKWDVVYKGVDLFTGNYSTSGTDLTFEGGYGIPVNVTRSYSSNSIDEGPLGKGWTLSVDVRSTAGGVLKSAGAPVRAVPVNFKDRPSQQLGDPNAELANGTATQPVEAVIATDAGGTEETIQKDADGLLTTPPWDKNQQGATTYEDLAQPDGSIYRTLKTNTTKTPDGTTYVYAKMGTYPYGTKPWNQPNATAEVANVLKIVSATDRQGNVTTYTYNTATTVRFQKANGIVDENPLSYIHMPNGHQINFGWTNLGTTQSPLWRITTATDGTRTVTYGYDASGDLTSVKTPQGTANGDASRTTTYGYGSSGSDSQWTGPVAGGLLTSITDPRGLATTIYYQTQDAYAGPSAAYVGTGVVVQSIRWPNGAWTAYGYGHTYRQGGTGFTGVNGAATDHTAIDWNGPQWANFEGSGRYQNVGAALDGDVGNGTGPNVFKHLGNEFYAKTLGNDWLQYDGPTQNLLSETHYTFTPGPAVSQGYDSWDLARQRGLVSTAGTYTESFNSQTDVQTSYNFMGNPLKKTMTEYPIGASSPSRTAIVEYAYWGADKYWQQKMVRDEGAALDGSVGANGVLTTTDRISYTDYYPTTAALGSRGQTSKVYDAKNSTYAVDPNTVYPRGVTASSANAWKYNLVPGDPNKYAASFGYDGKGRATDVYKLRAAPTSGAYAYVRTHTTYGADGTPTWGAAAKVEEDADGVDRTTQTTAYDSCGRAIEVQDASGKVFHTDYDLDGVVQAVRRVDGGLNQAMVSYAYGSTPGTLTNGQVTSVTDGLSGVTQSFGYVPRGSGTNPNPGYGQVAGVIESGGPNASYEVDYAYDDAGDRRTATYATPQGTTKWLYDDYMSVGSIDSPSRVFQTLARLDPAAATDVRTAEEFHYVYDTRGHLMESAFAQTPDAAQTPPTSGASWYGGGMTFSGAVASAVKKAGHRARAHYVYDPGGRRTLIQHWWDDLSGSSYGTPAPIRGNACDYELTGLARGLKTASYSYGPDGGGGWSLSRTETYGYDAANDQLVGASYGDGLANANPSWTYDAAGNRISDSTNAGTWSYDNLNRMATSPQGSYTHDVLGNRLTGPGGHDAYSWDAHGRMASLNKIGGFEADYAYRADGMRVRKETHAGAAGAAPTIYRYDGQMPVETAECDASSNLVTTERHALGARGLDMIERTSSTGTVAGFPLYDVHGDAVGVLTRSGTGWAIGNERTYDAWGGVRQGASTGAPSAQYCANLGHVQDDESGLVYMRARYYEPGTGRFVSEDRSHARCNDFAYASNNPVNRSDQTGTIDLDDIGKVFTFLLAWYGGYFTGGPPAGGPPPELPPDTYESVSERVKEEERKWKGKGDEGGNGNPLPYEEMLIVLMLAYQSMALESIGISVESGLEAVVVGSEAGEATSVGAGMATGMAF